jgi:hypothetical protein
MNGNEISLNNHRLGLAKELVDDIELSHLPPDQLLLKAYRLARLSEEIEIRTWLYFELNGYTDTEEARKYMDRVWRWTDKAKNLGWWVPFAAINGSISAIQVQIQQLHVPDVHLSVSSANPHEYVTGLGGANVAGISAPASKVLARLQELTTSITTLNSIRSRVLMGIHSFATETYYQLAFSGIAESIFQQHRTIIDTLLREKASDVLEMIPAINDRLVSGDLEAISQAMNSCRRIIKAFADAVYPPKDEMILVDGQQYQIGSDKVLNRITLYLRDNLSSETRRERLNKTIRLIHDRSSAGSHSDITLDEARSLFLQTYIILGEILQATKPKEQAKGESKKSA